MVALRYANIYIELTTCDNHNVYVNEHAYQQIFPFIYTIRKWQRMKKSVNLNNNGYC